MSWRVDNTEDDLSVLRGATILNLKIEDEPDGQQTLTMRVRYKDGLVVNDSRVGVYQIWQDAEGNGPGFIALVGNEVMVR